MEKRILKEFKNELGKEVQGLDLIVSLNGMLEDNTREVVIMEERDNGKVWVANYNANDNMLYDILEI